MIEAALLIFFFPIKLSSLLYCISVKIKTLMDLKNYIDSIQGWPQEGISFKDISPILANPKAFNESISGMCNLINSKPQMIAGVDARGFIFASAIAERLNIGMLLLRKGGKLPPPKIDIQYELEYGLDQLEIKEAQNGGTEIVLIDDILATGGTISAACDLCIKAGYVVKQALVLIDLVNIHEELTLSNGIKVESLIQLN
jgi:adenine phosphoribosyltransferase